MSQIKTYLPSELARIFDIHPNTVRLYEKLGYISKALRKPNGYREFTERHLLQLKICRHIFGYPFKSRRIRNAGNLVIGASADWNIESGKKYARHYIYSIQFDMDIAEKASYTLEQWSDHEVTNNIISPSEKQYNRKEIAVLLGITSETVRNWERNELISSAKHGKNNERIFDNSDLERLRIIYMLRQAGYSISSIHRCLSMHDRGHIDLALPMLNDPVKEEDLLSIGDRLLFELKRLENAALKIPLIFDEMETL